MMKLLVVRAERSHEREYLMQGARNMCLALPGHSIPTRYDEEGGRAPVDITRTYYHIVNDRDISTAIGELTSKFVGMDVEVYELVGSHQRIPGEIISKSVTKEGILPL